MHKVILAIFLMTSGSVFASALWGKAEAGASVEKIKALYPNGQEIAIDENLNIGTGANLRFKISDVDVLTDNYEASFYFQKESLEQVTLRFSKELSESVCDGKYTALVTALSGKYGAPVSAKGRWPSSQLVEATFSSGDNIVRTSGFTSSNKCNLYIFYKSKTRGSSSNL